MRLMYLFIVALLFGNVANATVTIVTPSATDLAAQYTSAAAVGNDCSKGLTVTFNASNILNPNNAIRVESSNKVSNKLVCYQYNGVYYGTSCVACNTVPTTILPSDTTAGANVTIFIPYLEMVDAGLLASLTSFTLTLGLDCSGTGCTAPTGSFGKTTDDTLSVTINIDNTPPTGYVNSFVIEKGDSSIYIDSFDMSGITDVGSGVMSARFYYSECGTVPDRSSAYQEFLVTSSNWVLTGLHNGTSYTLRGIRAK